MGWKDRHCIFRGAEDGYPEVTWGEMNRSDRWDHVSDHVNLGRHFLMMTLEERERFVVMTVGLVMGAATSKQAIEQMEMALDLIFGMRELDAPQP